MDFKVILLAVLAVAACATMTQETEAERPVDVLVYGYDEDGTGPISARHLALLESRGYVVKANNGPADADEMKDAKVVLAWRIGDAGDEDIREALEEYVYEGGRLLFLVDTPYSHCTSGSSDAPCHLDFTRDAFGFKFGSTVQYSTIYPAPGQEEHPIWNVPNKVSEFSDWCCDSYVEEIVDGDNIMVLSTVSGQSYRPAGYHTVQNVPAIIVNDNPDWNGGMVIGAGTNMIIGWQGPDTRLFENVLLFMLDDKTDITAPVIEGVEDRTFEAGGLSIQISMQMLGDITAKDSQDPDPYLVGYALAFDSKGDVAGPFAVQDENRFPVGTTVITWFARDAANNVSVKVQHITVSPKFETITDGFEDGQEWEEFGEVAEYVPSSGSTRAAFERYEFSIYSNAGNPAPSARISGDGFASYAGIQRDIRLDLLGDDDLFVGVDYTAGSSATAPFVVNANMQILDKDGNLLWGSWLGQGGTLKGGWQTFNYDVTEAVSGHDMVTVRLGVYDYWVAGWNVEAYFDNFYAGTERPSG